MPVAVMDGHCALCSFGARMIHNIEPAGRIRILPIQSPRGRAALAYFGLAPDDPASWLFIDAEKAWTGIDAMIAVGEYSGGWGRCLSLLRLIPSPLRPGLYRLIARNRYRLFGNAELCALPNPGLRARLIS
ncbi:MAG: DCC1-like thiol-disulfide oxidoreductase family protein [Pseudomonadota bacterium]